MVVGLLPSVVGGEDVEEEELMENNKVISNGLLWVEFAGIGDDFVVDAAFEVMLGLFLVLVEIDDAVELGCIVEASTDIVVEIALGVEE